jgi:hypothetical protein
MDSLEDLASAAREARSPSARPVARASGSNSTPIVLAILFGSLVIGGAIVFVAFRQGGAAPATPGSGQATAQQSIDAETLAQQVRAQTAAFRAFALRLPDALAHQRKAALEADTTGSDTVVTYTCNYTFNRMGSLNAPNGRPTTFTVMFNGDIEGKGRSYHSTDTVEITAGFKPTPDGHWKIDTASETTLTHKTSADLFGVPEKAGQKRDIAQVDWFNAAVNEAQKPERPKN